MTAADSPYRGTPVDDTPTNHSLSLSLASAHPTKKSLPRLTDKDRRQHLKKYNKLIKAGFEKSGAAAEVGYSLRAFQLWNRKLNKKWSNQKQKRNRISHIHHIEGDLRCFIQNEWQEGRYPVKNSLVMEKAKDMCGDFKSKNPNAQRNIIKKFMQRAKELWTRRRGECDGDDRRRAP